MTASVLFSVFIFQSLLSVWLIFTITLVQLLLRVTSNLLLPVCTLSVFLAVFIFWHGCYVVFLHFELVFFSPSSLLCTPSRSSSYAVTSTTEAINTLLVCRCGRKDVSEVSPALFCAISCCEAQPVADFDPPLHPAGV